MLDSILLNENKLAKLLLTDKKVYEFSGKIVLDYVGNWRTILLEQKSGYKISLVHRVEELVLNYGSKVAVNYWLTKKYTTEEELLDMTVKYQEGYIDVDFSASGYSYSEYTSGTDYDVNLKIDGHNLYKILEKKEGMYLYFMIEFLEEK